MLQEANVITPTHSGFGSKGNTLLHMMRTEHQRKAEIKDLEKDLERFSGTKIDSDRYDLLDRYKKSLSYLHGNFIEMQLWCKYDINSGDTIDLSMINKKTYKVEAIISRGDHKGRFKNPEEAINSHYVLVVTILTQPAPLTPIEKASKK